MAMPKLHEPIDVERAARKELIDPLREKWGLDLGPQVAAALRRAADRLEGRP